MKTGICTLIFCFLLAGCQKREYPPELVAVNSNIFFDATLDGSALNLAVGNDGYYCYASHRQSYDSIYVFKTTLRKYGCDNCGRALQVELTDYRQHAPEANINPDSSFRPGARHLIQSTRQVSFAALSNKAIVTRQWNFSNGDSRQESLVTRDLYLPGAQSVTLTVQTKGGCDSRAINTFYVDQDNAIFACSISSSEAIKNKPQFTANIVGGKPPYTYVWRFGDGDSSVLASPLHTYTYGGAYPASLRIEDAEHHVCEQSYIHVTGSDLSSCSANMSIIPVGKTSSLLNGARLQWTDEAQRVYSSAGISQPAESYFEVLDSKPFEKNERGETGRLLSLRLNVLLSDGSRKVWLKSDKASVAVSYK